MTSKLEMTAEDIARETGLSARMINIYRADAEKRAGMKFGRKEGRKTYFDGNEIRLILEQRESSGNGEFPRNSGNFREAVNFSHQNVEAECSTFGSMEQVVAAADQNSAAIGQALAQRSIQIVWTTYAQTMQSGMAQLAQQFTEMHAAISLPLAESPQLPGLSTPTSRQIEGGEE